MVKRIKGLLRNRYVKASINLFGRLVGIINTIVILKFLGTGKEVDYFVIAYSLYNYFVNLIGPIIEAQTTAYLNFNTPFSSIYKFAIKLSGYSIIPISFVAVYLIIYFGLIYSLLLFSSLTSVLSASFFGYATHKEDWINIFISNIIRLGISIACIVTFHTTLGIKSAVFGIIFGDLAKVFYLYITYHIKTVSSHIPQTDIGKEIFKQIPSHLLNGLIPVSNRYIASYYGIPKIIYLDLAEKIYSGFAILFSHLLITPKFNDWSSVYITNAQNTRKNILRFSIFAMLGGSGIAILAYLIITYSGLLKASDFILPTLFYLIGLGPYLSGQVLVKLTILEKSTHILSYISVLQIIINITFTLFLAPIYGILGVAISTTLAFGVATVICWVYLLKKKEVRKEDSELIITPFE